MEKQDTILIEELKINTLIGVYDWERTVKQNIWVDLELQTSIQAAAETGDLQQTIDYTELVQALTTFVQSQRWNLIETLVEHMANFLLQTYPIEAVGLTVRKPGAIPNAKAVGVRIQRTRKSSSRSK